LKKLEEETAKKKLEAEILKLIRNLKRKKLKRNCEE